MKPEMTAEKKLVVECRVESGCLGPEGKDYVDGFCAFAKKELATVDGDYINWDVVPRQNTSQSEVEFRLAGKSLSRQQASRYLILFDRDIEKLEAQIDDQLISLIEQYMN